MLYLIIEDSSGKLEWMTGSLDAANKWLADHPFGGYHIEEEEMC